MKKDKLFAGLALSIGVALVIFITLASVIYASNAATVYFDAGQGDKAIKLKYRDGELNHSLPTPEDVTGYTFGGWYMDDEFMTEFELSLLPDKGKVNVFAKWIPNIYTITLNLNGGEGVSEINAAYMTTAIQPEDPAKFGYNFIDWYIDIDKTIAYDFSTPITEDITLYAGWSIKQYTVSFQTNGGSAIISQYLEHDSILSAPTSPTKEDSVFIAWYSDEDCTIPYDFNALLQSDMTLYALWVPAFYDITLDYGTGNMEISTGYNLPLLRPEDPSREGYTFINWYIDSEHTMLFDFDTLIDSEFTLYGDWTINSYTVTFTGAEGYDDIVTEYDTLILKPTEDPERYGYTFGGWYEGEVLFDFDVMTIKHDTELYAYWIANTYRITLEALAGETEVEYVDVIFDSEIECLPVPVLIHYDLVGWNKISDGTGDYIANGDIYTLADDITLYAQYTYTHYDVIFDMDGGSNVETQSVLYLDSAVRPADPIKRGYTFDNWYSDSEKIVLYDFDTPLEDDITVYAGWIINVYTVSFFSEEELYDSIDTNFNTTILSPADPMRTGYDFLGWSIEEQIGEVFVPENGFFNFDTRIEDDTALYAWWKLTDYYLNLEATGGDVDPDYIIVHYQFLVGNMPEPVRRGYTFIEWNTESEGMGDTYTSATLFNNTEDIDLYAIWEINKYTVTFISNGDTIIDPIENVPYYTTIEEPIEPSRVGHSFIGWFIDSEFIEEFDFVDPIEDDMTLYGGWSANLYYLIFNGQGGSEPIDYGVYYSNMVGELPISERAGYTFLSWNTESDGSGNHYDSDTIYLIPGNTDLYAQWQANQYTVTFNYQGATGGNTTAEKTVTFDNQYGVLPIPSRTGYDFDGWFNEITGGDQMLVATLVTTPEDHALYAHWTPKTYLLTFNFEGATGGMDPLSKVITYDFPIGALPIPEKTGYTFEGWFTETEGMGDEYNATTVYTIADSSDIYADWEPIEYLIDYVLYNGNNDPLNPTVYTIEDNITFLDASLTGYDFIGWYDSEDNEVTGITAGEYGDVTLYASYEPIDYTVTFDYQGATGDNATVSKIVTFDAQYEDLPEPTKIGYTFDGWFTESIGGNLIDWLTDVTTASDHILYAQWTANEYAVTYDSNKPAGASDDIEGETASSTHTYDLTADLAINGYTLTGWTFDGWNTAADATGTAYVDGEEILNLTTDSGGEVTLYAIWTANTYSVTYVKNKPITASGTVEGTTVNSSHVYDTASSLTALGYTLTGYSLKEWNTSSNGTGTAYAEGAEISTLTAEDDGTVTLYAIWSANLYNMTYNPQGALEPTNTILVRFDSPYGNLTTPIRTGYNFDGWFTESEGGSEITILTKVAIASNHTIYAHWTAITYTVSYNTNKPDNASADVSGATSDSSHTYDTAANLTSNSYSLTGWTFDGWNTLSNGTGTDYAEGASVTNLTSVNESTVTLYAQWTANSYTVSYNGNKPAGASGSVTGTTAGSSHIYDTSSSLTECGFMLTGWTFEGWNTVANGSGADYADEANVSTLTAMSGGSVTLYAQWVANTYTVQYYGNKPTGASGEIGGSTNNLELTYDIAADLNANGYTLTGWTFAGWNTLANGTGTSYEDEENIVNLTESSGGEVQLYAQWNANTYTVTYNKNKPTSSSNNVSGTTANTSHIYDTASPLRTIGYTLTGWTFSGWNTAINGSGTAYDDSANVSTLTPVSGGSFTLYAQWTANAYTVSYNSNKPAIASGEISGLTVNSSHTYDIAKAITSNGYSLTGWTFTGWATASDGSVAYDDEESVSNLTSTDDATVTLYAVWTANTYTVTYNSNKPDSASGTIIGTTSDSSHTYDVYENLTFNGYTLTGWTFEGWATASDGEVTYCDLDLVNNLSAEDNANVTLYGIWTANGYTIAYNSNKPAIASSEVEGTTSSSSHIYDVSSNLTANGYSLTGWTFEGWNTQSDELGDSLEDEESILNLVDVDGTIITIYAVWKSNSYSIKYDSNIPETATGEMSGETSDSYHYYDYSAPLLINVYSLTGWAFDGWAASAAGAVLYDDGESVNNLTSTDGATVTLYAVWTANSYTVSYNSNKPATASNDISGTTSNSSHTYDVSANLTANGYALIGWTFDGWATSSAGAVFYDNEESVSNLTSTNGATVTLYAIWTANTYTVTYNLNKPATASNEVEGITANSSHTYDTAANLTLNGYTLTGWTFDGWATTSAGAEAYEDEESVSNLTSTHGATVTLYAVWTANTYTVNFNAQGGLVDPVSNSVTFDEEVGTLPTPTYTGYTFLGWFTEYGGNGDEYINTTKYTVASHLCLYACWAGTAGLQYTASAGGYLVAAGTADTSGVVYIPVYHEGEYVIGVASEGFRTKTDMIGIEFGYGSELNMIGNNAFRNCSSLIDIDLPDMVMSIGDGAFKRSGLKTFTMPGELVSIGDNAFEYCEGLTNITLESPLETIGESAFAGTGITSFTLPESIVTIGEEAFYDCALEEIYVMSLTPCSLGDYAFYHDPYVPGFQIYVDSSVYDDYLVADGWSDYSGYIVGIII